MTMTITKRGATMAATATQPFRSALVNSIDFKRPSRSRGASLLATHHADPNSSRLTSGVTTTSNTVSMGVS